MSYTGQERTDCFKGTAARNTITNVTVAEYEFGSGSDWQFSQPKTPIDVSKLYRIDASKAEAGAIAQLQECVGLFSNRR
jgi:hypothetical protein